MIEFPKPKNLNGSELLDELAAIGIVLDKYAQAPLVDGEGRFYLDVQQKDKEAVAAVVAAHNGTTDVKELSVSEKLASVGLKLDDLKAALGL